MSLRYLRPLLGMLLLAACGTPTPPTPIAVNVDTTDLAAPLLLDLSAAYATMKPDVVIVPNVAPLPSVAADLKGGSAALALTGQPDPELYATPLGYASFAIIVNPANSINGLSGAQLQEIFAGRLNDWSQLGGPGQAIQVVSREEGSDAELAFGAGALSGVPPVLTALVAPTWEAMRQIVSQNPSAIGYLLAAELDPTVKVVSLDETLRVLIVAQATKEPTGAARDFLLWAQSAEGQAVAARRYLPYP